MTSLDRKLHLAASFSLLCIPAFLLFSRAIADISVVLVGLLFLVRSWNSRDWSWAREKDILVLLIIFVLMNVLVSPFAEYVGKSYGRSFSWLRFVIFYAAVTRWVLVDELIIRRFLAVLLFTVAVAAIDAIYQFCMGYSVLSGHEMHDRLTGPLDRPNIGMYLSKLGIAAMAMAFVLKAKKFTNISFIIGCGLSPILLTVIFLSGERAASVLTLLALVIILVSLCLSGAFARRVSIGLAVCISGALAFLLSSSDYIWERAEALVADISGYTETIYGQLAMLGLRFFGERPLTGTGMGNFSLVCKDYVQQGVDSALCHPHPHNFYVEWLSDTGLIGTIPFTIFMVILYWMGVKALFGPRESRLLGGLYLGVLVMSLFPFSVTQSLFSNWPAMLAWLSISVAVAALRFANHKST
ncbi:O-antigen ligase family protein [Thalassospira sp.]|uniref:O-antigen ligase family protein n=1 Tax=Thalassospira sp. TaxID=1912094 RepID=UPI000C583C95|nr:O-antigen ligase family protein [Thalassospira sp.]MBC07408.1 polymerase [Thalassospira sp.]|tara:strand:+ start:1061 stop:2296 length:1236 start_codon:yes stop_codon:yes gene_type:complete